VSRDVSSATLRGCHGFPSQEDGYLGHPSLDAQIATIAARQHGVISTAWTKTAEQILESLARYGQRINQSRH
jgi:hypothetical protein